MVIKIKEIIEVIKRGGVVLCPTDTVYGLIADAANKFDGQKYQPDLIINVGNLPKSKPSKVVDLTTKKPKILRP